MSLMIAYVIYMKRYQKVCALCHKFLMAIGYGIEMNFGGLIIGYNSNLHGEFY